MTAPTHIRTRVSHVARHSRRGLAALMALAIVAGSGSTVAAAFGAGGGAGRFRATFEAQAVGDPSVTSCRDLPGNIQQVQARYRGRIRSGGETKAFNFTTKVRFDRRTGVSTVQGDWRVVEDGEVVARGELIGAALVSSDPPTEADPPSELQVQGLLIGLTTPPDPDKPALSVIGNFVGSITDGTLNFTGSVGDPTVGELLPAVQIASGPC